MDEQEKDLHTCLNSLLCMKNCVIVLAFILCFDCVRAQRLSRDLNLSIITNQVGYTPGAVKTCVLKTDKQTSFDVVEITTGKIVFSGTMVPSKSDFGEFATADFTRLNKTGHYYIKADTVRSYAFSISADVYQPQINDVINYFSKQRCGASTTGYLTPCHTDDGIRFDNG
jgi:hypothetical protein